MEGAIKTVVSVFLKSAKGKENLGEKDFQNLVKNQLKNILTGGSASEDYPRKTEGQAKSYKMKSMSDTDSSKAIKDMRQGLDENQDGKVSFQEYMHLVGYLAQAVSDQRCSNETQVANSGPETQSEVPETLKAEPEAEKEETPKKEEESAKEQDEVVEVVEVVEVLDEEESVEEVVEVVERT